MRRRDFGRLLLAGGLLAQTHRARAAAPLNLPGAQAPLNVPGAQAPLNVPGAQAPMSLRVAVGGMSLFSYLSLPLADRLGFFRDAGLSVELHDFQGGSKSLEALIGGSVDAVVGGYENTVLMQAKGLDLTNVMLMTDRFGLVLGLTPEAARRYRKPADLKGMRIGVTAPGSAAANAVDIILAKGGLTPKDVQEVGVGAGPSAVAAMRAGQIDGLLFSDPYITRLQQDGMLVPVIDTRTASGQEFLYGGPSACSGAYVQAETARAQRPAVQAFVNGLVRATRWIASQGPEAVADAVPPEFLGEARALYVAALAANMPTFSADGVLTVAMAQATYRAMQETGRLPPGANIELARTFDASFAQAANRSI